MSKTSLVDTQWDLVIKPRKRFFNLPLKDIWNYRDLIYMFVKRDVVTVYKQTILGPIWFIVQPLLTTLMYVVVFGRIAKLSTDGLPQILFYLAGIVVWNYFSETFNTTSKTFTENANVFGKVYFPRLVVPLSKVISGFIKFFIQFVFFLAVLLYYSWTGAQINPNIYILITPLLLLIMGGLGLGAGIIFTSLTTKYRDLVFLIQFGVQLLMYATPIIYPVSSVPEKYKLFLMLNPMSSIVEGFRFAFLGTGGFSWMWLGYSAAFTLVLLLVGTLIFNRVEKTFMDTV